MTESLQLSGYEDRKELLATRYTRAGKSLFVVALPLHLIPTHLPIPNPEEPFEGNRRVNKTHAVKFGEYWREGEKWACPPLLLDTTFPLSADFEPKYNAGGVEFGILRLPHNSAQELDILDGQHRILGWVSISETLINEAKKARENLQGSKAAEDPVGIQVWEEKLKKLNEDQQRLRKEYVTLEILEGVSREEHKQYFHDIAVNARGITKSVTVSFDRRNVMNRVALSLAEAQPLLVGRVDFEKDRVVGGNENFISGRNLVDVVKHVAIGIDGRMTLRREKSFRESSIETMADKFMAALVESFPEMKKLIDEELHPSDLRQESLLGSPTILRVLAGAYHQIAVDITDEDKPFVTSAGDAKARNLFAALSSRMSLPISEEWFGTGYFPERDSKAPSSRSQDLRGLTDLVASWGTSGKPFS
jgi:hypothetical protein